MARNQIQKDVFLSATHAILTIMPQTGKTASYLMYSAGCSTLTFKYVLMLLHNLIILYVVILNGQLLIHTYKNFKNCVGLSHQDQLNWIDFHRNFAKMVLRTTFTTKNGLAGATLVAKTGPFANFAWSPVKCNNLTVQLQLADECSATSSYSYIVIND